MPACCITLFSQECGAPAYHRMLYVFYIHMFMYIPLLTRTDSTSSYALWPQINLYQLARSISHAVDKVHVNREDLNVRLHHPCIETVNVLSLR